MVLNKVITNPPMPEKYNKINRCLNLFLWWINHIVLDSDRERDNFLKSLVTIFTIIPIIEIHHSWLGSNAVEPASQDLVSPEKPSDGAKDTDGNRVSCSSNIHGAPVSWYSDPISCLLCVVVVVVVVTFLFTEESHPDATVPPSSCGAVKRPCDNSYRS